ncbi:hypothetical protein TNCV_652711 [Trichonephila clavipes]|nr:hypothetical protein TNCV_652711 [Trichonephila clavipes]
MVCDTEDCGFQKLNDDEIVTSMKKESYPVDDETDEDEDNNNNESSKGQLNADVFSAVDRAMEWYEQQSEYLTATTQENHRHCREKTVYNGTAKNK